MEDKRLNKQDSSNYKKTDIAIIGMSCRFPDASDYQQYWKNMVGEICSIKKIKEERWNLGNPSLAIPEKNGWSTDQIVKYCGTVEDLDKFDPDFFAITPREAACMDPQQRFLLEETWHCIEDSGISLKELQTLSTSVFVGATGNDYELSALTKGEETDGYASLGNFACLLSNRISHCFKLKGESMTLDTACSSSLVAIHKAKQSLNMKESKYAVVAGVCLSYHPWRYISFSKSHMMSPDGTCRAFDEDANGFVQGEGVGVLLLQSVEDAVKEKSHIYGIIKGSAVNHCAGEKNITAPSMHAQKEVIERALKDARVRADSVNYIETHGTGTSLGDPIEIEALRHIFEASTDRRKFCTIGSVKTNIGHLASASGVAGVIRTLLMMKYKKIPKMLNLTELNPLLDWENTPFRVAIEKEDWIPMEEGAPLRAGVSGFGFGGVNAHIILEDYQKGPKAAETVKGPYLFGLSSQTKEGLQEQVNKWKIFLENEKELDGLDSYDVCATWMNSRRTYSDNRVMALISDTDEMKAFLKQTDMTSNAVLHEGNKVYVCLTGEEEKYLGGEKKLQQYKLFEQELKNVYKQSYGRNLKLGVSQMQEEERKVCFSVVWIRSLQKLGIKIAQVTCEKEHILGAMAACQMIPIKEACQIAARKKEWKDASIKRPSIPFLNPFTGDVIQCIGFGKKFVQEIILGITFSKTDGETLDFYINKAEKLMKNQFTYKKYLEGWNKVLNHYQIQAIDLIKQCRTREGDTGETEKVKLLLTLMFYGSLKKLNQKWNLSESREFENIKIQQVIALFLDGVVTKEGIADLLLSKQPDVDTFIRILENNQKNIVDYSKYMDETMLFTGLEEIASLIENSKSQISNIDDEIKKPSVRVAETEFMPEEQTDNVFLDLIKNVWMFGMDIDFSLLYPNGSYQKLPLPGYVFQKKAYWIDTLEKINKRKLGPMIDEDLSDDTTFLYKKTLRVDEFFVGNHIINNQVIVPGVAYLEMAKEAFESAIKRPVTKIYDIGFKQWIEVKDTRDAYVEINVKEDYAKYEVYTMTEGRKTLHSMGKITAGAIEEEIESIPIELIKKKCNYQITKEKCYGKVFRDFIGFDYGPGFQVTQYGMGNVEESLELLKIPSFLSEDFYEFGLHPSILDAALRAVTWVGGEDAYKTLRLCIPFAIGKIEIFGPMDQECYSYARMVSSTKEKSVGTRRFDVFLTDKNGKVLVKVHDFIIRQIPKDSSQKALCYAPLWKESSIRKNITEKSIIHFCAQGELKSTFLNEFQKNGKSEHFYAVIQKGEAYKKISEFQYEIRPDVFEDYCNCIEALCGDMKKEIAILFQPEFYGEDVNDYILIRNLYLALYQKAEKKKIHFLTAISQDDQRGKAMGGLHQGFFKSVKGIGHGLKSNVLYYEETMERETQIYYELLQESSYGDQEIRYHGGNREKRVLVPVEIKEVSENNIRKNGWYLITGGFGKLGISIAKEILSKANVILLGRSTLTPEREEILRELNQQIGQALYRRCDVADKKALQMIASDLQSQKITIHGILHLAGCLGKHSFLEATTEEECEVLNPKVLGTVNLDEIFKEENLDFFVVFSSISALIGDFGRGSYAAGNGFMDGFIEEREEHREQGKRYGKSFSINWPIWKEGGMQLNEDEGDIYYKISKLQDLDMDQGKHLLWNVLKSDYERLAVMTGEEKEVERMLNVWQRDIPCKAAEHALMPQEIRKGPKEQLTNYLKELISKGIGKDLSEIDTHVSFSKYQMDSIIILDLNEMLEKKFKDIPKTLFFEYDTVSDLTDYFMENYEKEVQEHFHVMNEAQDVNENLFARVEGDAFSGHLGEDKEVSASVRYLEKPKEYNGDIAIIGLDGKYPMADTLEEFWENLKNGKNCVTEIPKDRWDGNQYFDEKKDIKNRMYCKWGAFLNKMDYFDADFFQMTPREAELIDPSERLMLECAYHTIEDAGYDRGCLSGKKIGVFVGVMNSQYQLYGAMEYMRGNLYDVHSSFASIANRISYFYDFHGPSIAVDTMCSSALSAIHLACNSIRSGDSEMALAGSVNVIMHPAKYIFLSEEKFGSSEGKCRAFGNGGDGYVPGEGVGAVLLKPLQDAVRDRDHIYGVIKGIAENHGGKVNSYTVPNPKAQTLVIQEALMQSGIDPKNINYIETHGTGTALGDPIEIAGLSKLYKKEEENENYCAIGSVKTNIGHLEGAAGMASLTKVLLQMKHKMLVPSLWAKQLNPNIQFEKTSLYVQQNLEEWKPAVTEGTSDDIMQKRCAGISAFGAGGVNVHMIVEEYVPEDEKLKDEAQEYLIVLSAKNQKMLKLQAHALARFLSSYGRKGVVCREQENKKAHTMQIVKEITEEVCRMQGINKETVEIEESLCNLGLDQVNTLKLLKMLRDTYGFEQKEREYLLSFSIQSLALKIAEDSRGIEEQNSMYQSFQLDFSMEQLEYTLQTGREAFHERLAIVSGSLNEILDALLKYVDGECSRECLFVGSSKGGRDLKLLFADGMGQQFIHQIIKSKDKKKLAELWLQGVDFDWVKLYENEVPRKISIPKHVFDTKPYWIGKELLDPKWHLVNSETEGDVLKTQHESGEVSSAVLPEKKEAPDTVSPSEQIIAELRHALAEVTFVEESEVDNGRPFAEYGINSVLAAELINKINDKLGVHIEVVQLFSYVNIEHLAEHILKQMGGEKGLMSLFQQLENGDLSVGQAELLLGGI